MKHKKQLWIYVFLFLIVSSFATANLLSDVDAYYKFDNNALDSVGLYNGTANNSYYPTGIINQMSYYNGNANHTNISSNLAKSTTENYTINMWLNTTQTDRRMFLSSQTDVNNFFQMQTNWYGGATRVNSICVDLVSGGSYSLQCDSSTGLFVNGTVHGLNFTNGQFFMVTLVFNNSGQNAYLYINGVLRSNRTGLTAQPFPTATIRFGQERGISAGLGWIGGIDEVAFYKGYQLNQSEITSLYNSGVGFTYPFVSTAITMYSPTPINNATLHVTNNTFYINTSATEMSGVVNTTQYVYYYNGSLYTSITNNSQANVTNIFTNIPEGIYFFNATATNSTYQVNSTTRQINIYNLTSSTIIYPTNNTNITRYLNITWTNTTSTNNSVQITSYKVWLNNTLFNTTTIPNMTNYDTYYNNLSIGTFNITIEGLDSNGYSVNSSKIYFNHNTNALLNITAVNISGILINTFNVTIQGTTYTTTNGYILADLVKNNNYTISVNSSGYAYTTRTINLTNYTQILNVTLYPTAALLITLYDEETNTLINQPITITITDITNPFITTGYTTNGTTLIQNLIVEDLLEVKFNSTNYTTSRNYQIILSNSYNTLTAYLLKKSSAQNFSICWYNTNGVPINSLHVYQFFLTNGSYALTQDIYTDINGRSEFTYTDTHYYLYNFTSTTYSNSPFILNPPDNTNTLSSGCNYDVTLSFSEQAPAYNTANVTGSATFNNNTNILTFTYTSYNTSYTTYYYNVTKIVQGVELVLCSDSSTSTTDTFTCNLLGYYDTVTVKGYADNQIFYGGYIQLNPTAKLFQNIEEKDGAYLAGFIMLIIVFGGIFFGLLGTMIAGVAGLIAISWLGLVEPLTLTIIIIDIVVVMSINIGLKRWR